MNRESANAESHLVTECRFTLIQSVFIAIVVFGFVGQLSADPPPDPSLWGGGVINPNSGLTFVPLIYYDESTDELIANTLGLNGVSDTPVPDTNLLGDDGAMPGLLIRSPQPLTMPISNQIIGGIHYLNVQYNSTISVLQIGGFPIGPGPIFQPLPTTVLATYPDGTTCGDFSGNMEFLALFGHGWPSQVLFATQVQCVPEPGCAMVFWFAGLSPLIFLRSKERRCVGKRVLPILATVGIDLPCHATPAC